MAVGYCFHLSWSGGRAAAATLSWLDLCDHKLEKIQTWHTGTYHGLVVQRHGQAKVQPLTLTQ